MQGEHAHLSLRSSLLTRPRGLGVEAVPAPPPSKEVCERCGARTGLPRLEAPVDNDAVEAMPPVDKTPATSSATPGTVAARVADAAAQAEAGAASSAGSTAAPAEEGDVGGVEASSAAGIAAER